MVSRSSVVHQWIGGAPPDELLWRLSVDQYHAMIAGGILTDDDPVELLQGWLVVKMPKNPAHSLSTRLIRAALEQIIPDGWYVDSQEPITTMDSEPEPDVMVVRGQPRDYASQHPTARDIALIIEVADTTLRRDRTLKKSICASAGIPVFWIINLPERLIEVYADPVTFDEDSDYRDCKKYSGTEQISVIIEDQDFGKVSVEAILP